MLDFSSEDRKKKKGINNQTGLYLLLLDDLFSALFFEGELSSSLMPFCDCLYVRVVPTLREQVQLRSLAQFRVLLELLLQVDHV